ncbi:hypothetical protein PULV_a1679 [Pseudoalteromonas ulvae UL12]|uniref:hypothetical protein n=1 Tax=Pseudoalteromonas ulvae TaxID=107327 RepID=UPI00186B60A3|nr:hypothetical protein [Pseudoalteromonas ulvae]MBE0364118.1 hypothetical protein [Pseudoalteromonas ulvae UL12]
MFRSLLMATALLCLVACSDQDETAQIEAKHISSYTANLHNVMINHYNLMSQVQHPAQSHEQQQKTLADIKRVKTQFEQYSEHTTLQTIVTLYDTALNQLFIRNLQLLELSAPLWVLDPNLRFNLTQDDYYFAHQSRLTDLINMVDEFDSLMLEHLESVRQDMMASNLTKQQRIRVWPDMQSIVGGYLSSIKPTIHSLKGSAKVQREHAEKLYNQAQQFYNQVGSQS